MNITETKNDIILIRNWTKSTDEVAKILGRSAAYVSTRRRQLELYILPGIVEGFHVLDEAGFIDDDGNLKIPEKGRIPPGRRGEP